MGIIIKKYDYVSGNCCRGSKSKFYIYWILSNSKAANHSESGIEFRSSPSKVIFSSFFFSMTILVQYLPKAVDFMLQLDSNC